MAHPPRYTTDPYMRSQFLASEQRGYDAGHRQWNVEIEQGGGSSVDRMQATMKVHPFATQSYPVSPSKTGLDSCSAMKGRIRDLRSGILPMPLQPRSSLSSSGQLSTQEPARSFSMYLNTMEEKYQAESKPVDLTALKVYYVQIFSQKPCDQISKQGCVKEGSVIVATCQRVTTREKVLALAIEVMEDICDQVYWATKDGFARKVYLQYGWSEFGIKCDPSLRPVSNLWQIIQDQESVYGEKCSIPTGLIWETTTAM